MNRFVCLLLVVVLGCGLTVASASAATIVDDFSVAHDYLGGTAGTIWDGVLNGANATAINAAAGQLNIGLQPGGNENGGYGWDNLHANAPFLYKNVDGTQDFTVQVQAAGGTQLDWNFSGLMVRKDDTNFVAAGLANFGNPVTSMGWSVTNGAEIDSSYDAYGASPYLRLAYTAATSTFNFWSSTDGASWTARNWGNGSTDLVRTDMAGAMQVGLHFDSYVNDPTGQNAQFDNFSLTTTPEPSTIVLLLTGLIGLMAYAWRKRK